MSSSNAPSDPPPRASLAAELDAAFGENETDTDRSAAAFLVGLMGNSAGKLYRIPRGESILGRSSKAFLSLQEKGVSHQHARLTLNANGCHITDLESTNGTRVNDIRIHGSQQLLAGDVIRLGQATLGFLTDAEDEQQHTRALARVTQPHRGLLSNIPTHTGAMVTAPTMGTPGPPIIHSSHPPEQAMIMPRPVGPPHNTPPSATEKLDSILDKTAIILGFLGRYGWLLAFSSLGLATLFAATVALSPPLAVAQFEVFLRDDPQARNPNPTAPQIGFFEFATKDFANPDLVKETLGEMGLKATPKEVNSYAKSLSLEQMGRVSPFFVGTYSHVDGVFAKRFLGAHLKNFLEYEISEAIGAKLDNVRLLREQYEENHKNLLASESELSDFKKKHLSSLPEQVTQQLTRQVDLVAHRDLLAAQLDRASRELSLAQQQLNSKEWLVGSQRDRMAPYDSALGTVRTKIAEAKAKGYADAHPELRRLRDEEQEYLRLKKTALETAPSEPEQASDPEYRALKQQVAQLKVTVAASSSELGQVQARLGEIADVSRKMPGVEAELAEKLRRVEVSRRHHDKLFEALKAKELELDLERNNVRSRYEVIRSPTATMAAPVTTAMARAGVGGVLGFIFGLIGAMIHWLYRYAKNRHKVVTAPVSSSTALARTEMSSGNTMQKWD